MDVEIPDDLDSQERAAILEREREYAGQVQRDGKWIHLWRVVGKYSNVSIFDVSSNEELHEILWNLPLFKYLTMAITPLTLHPGAIER